MLKTAQGEGSFYGVSLPPKNMTLHQKVRHCRAERVCTCDGGYTWLKPESIGTDTDPRYDPDADRRGIRVDEGARFDMG
jgi:hypothetical protein